MVGPEDFLRFAREFHASGDEIHRRRAVSGAYYAAFHHLRDIAEERVGLPRFGTADDHLDILKAMDEIEPLIADDFDSLRRLRVIADYYVERGIGPRDALECYEAAARVLAFD